LAALLAIGAVMIPIFSGTDPARPIGQHIDVEIASSNVGTR
jgi:hypothetical protein